MVYIKAAFFVQEEAKSFMSGNPFQLSVGLTLSYSVKPPPLQPGNLVGLVTKCPAIIPIKDRGLGYSLNVVLG